MDGKSSLDQEANPRTFYDAFVHEIFLKIHLLNEMSIRDDIQKKLSHKGDIYVILFIEYNVTISIKYIVIEIMSKLSFNILI